MNPAVIGVGSQAEGELGSGEDVSILGRRWPAKEPAGQVASKG